MDTNGHENGRVRVRLPRIEEEQPANRGLRQRILITLRRLPRALTDGEIAQNLHGGPVGFAAVRTETEAMAREGLLEHLERDEPYNSPSLVRRYHYYWLAGTECQMLPIREPVWEHRRPASYSESNAADEARLLELATTIADAKGRLNRQPLADAGGWTPERVSHLVMRLRLRGAWPYRWRYGGAVMSERVMQARIWRAGRLKAERERAHPGKAIQHWEWDLLFDEETAQGRQEWEEMVAGMKIRGEEGLTDRNLNGRVGA